MCEKCSLSLKMCPASRRCFMSGEYCSQLSNIQKGRQSLYMKNEINAFVIMNYSNMSDVAYKWRLEPFVKSLKKYLKIDSRSNDLICYRSEDEAIEALKENEDLKNIKRINVIRADTTYASNYVICNRICQQIQIADLVIVDVSVENNNVFYEFGMAMAHGKLILPICYSESFYQIVYPDGINSLVNENFKRHIDCYPWRRALFEYYGLRYRNQNSSTKYLEFNDATNSVYGYSDIQYNRFPYVDSISKEHTDKSPNSKDTTANKRNSEEETSLQIGKILYERLKNSYNKASSEHNTLIVYTMDGFLNAEQAGQCMVNYYEYITRQLEKMSCFCGDRIGVLIQSSKIPENVKDAKTEKYLPYNAGEIIHLGVNQAAFAAQKASIKTDDFLNVKMIEEKNEKNNGYDVIYQFIKGYLGNRGIAIYPKTPVYVKRILQGQQRKLLDIKENDDLEYYFCFFHIMLRTLRYVNQMVVDISKNSLESLFWLGVAHGANVNTITVRHQESEQERRILTGSPDKRERDIFDVAGLWSAIFRSSNTEGFYHQLELAQMGLEQHSKLMLPNVDYYRQTLEDCLFGVENDFLPNSDNKTDDVQRMKEILADKQNNELFALESYYRDRFWKPLMNGEHLYIYFAQHNLKDDDNEPKSVAGRWDINAVGALSHYLSVRTHIGEYSLHCNNLATLNPQVEGADFNKATTQDVQAKEAVDDNVIKQNVITIGADVKPFFFNENARSQSLVEVVGEKLVSNKESIYVSYSYTIPVGKTNAELCSDKTCMNKLKDDLQQKQLGPRFKGFHKEDEYLLTQIPWSFCAQQLQSKQSDKFQPSIKKMNKKELSKLNGCSIVGKTNTHFELGQLVLWREVDRDCGKVWYQVALNGASGPATLALSGLLINENCREMLFELTEQSFKTLKQDNFLSDKKDGEKLKEDLKAMAIPLSDLQKEIRKKIMERFMNNIHIQDQNQAFDKLSLEEKHKKVSVAYLSGILYRYFLPFLSLEDEEKLVNGMEYFLLCYFASYAEKEYETVQKNVQFITEKLKDILCQLRGMEAIYQVEVDINPPEKNASPDLDTRKIRSIRLLDLAGTESVKCLFFEEKKQNSK